MKNFILRYNCTMHLKAFVLFLVITQTCLAACYGANVEGCITRANYSSANALQERRMGHLNNAAKIEVEAATTLGACLDRQKGLSIDGEERLATLWMAAGEYEADMGNLQMARHHLRSAAILLSRLRKLHSLSGSQFDEILLFAHQVDADLEKYK